MASCHKGPFAGPLSKPLRQSAPPSRTLAWALSSPRCNATGLAPAAITEVCRASWHSADLLRPTPFPPTPWRALDRIVAVGRGAAEEALQAAPGWVARTGRLSCSATR